VREFAGRAKLVDRIVPIEPIGPEHTGLAALTATSGRRETFDDGFDAAAELAAGAHLLLEGLDPSDPTKLLQECSGAVLGRRRVEVVD